MCAFLRLADLLGILTGWIIYFASYLVIRFVVRIKAETVGGESKLSSIGIGTYFIIWNTVWITIFTAMNPQG